MAANQPSFNGNGAGGVSNLCLPIFEHAPLPIATVEGISHIVRYVNPAFCRLVDKPLEEIVGKPFGELGVERDECLPLLDRVDLTGQPESYTTEQSSKSHPFFWSYIMWPLMADNRSGGVVIQVTETAQFHKNMMAMNEALLLGSVHQHELTEAADWSNALLQVEIGERQEAEAALHRAQAELIDHARQLSGLVAERTAELTAINKQLEAFVYSIAHDLRAPLRSMQGFATLLVEQERGFLDPTSKDCAERINKSAKFMDALLIDLLAFSRISQQNIELVPVSLETAVAAVLARLQTDIEEKKATVEIAATGPSVMAHEQTLTQVLFNLMSNALKFSAASVAPAVRLRTEEKEGMIRVWVEDNGPGIAAAHQEQIFRLFTRLDGEKHTGTGVGLAIVQKGVERMGRRAGVESAPGKGSRFWFELKKSPPA